MKRVSRTYTVNKIYSVDLFPVFFLTRLRFSSFFCIRYSTVLFIRR